MEKQHIQWMKVMEKARDWSCKPSPPDERDFLFKAIVGDKPLPPAVRLDGQIPLILDQGKIGSCVGMAAAGIKNRQEWIQQNFPEGGLSPAFIYSLCKQEDGMPDQEGTFPRVAMKVLQKIGVCPERVMPYSTLKDGIHVPKPTAEQRAKAEPYRIKAYARLNGLDDIKLALASGQLVLAAVLVTASFMEPAKGKFILKPSGLFMGGHAIVLCGYDDNLTYNGHKGFVRMVNSWGPGWGDKGFAWIAYDALSWKTVDTGTPFLFEAWSTVDVTLPRDADEIILWPEKDIALVDGEEFRLNQEPVILPGTNRSVGPYRFLGNMMGRIVDWKDGAIILRKPSK